VNWHLWELIAVGVLFVLSFASRSARKVLATTFKHPLSGSVIARDNVPAASSVHQATGTILDGNISAA
jgi:hypothetical protein